MATMKVKGTPERKKVPKTAKKVWTPEMEAELIEAVHQVRVIWDYTEEDYKERRSRNEGFIEVLNKLKPLNPDLTVSMCKSKWNNLRSYYQILVNKQRKKSGETATIQPTWPNFYAMRFLNPTMTTTEAIGTFQQTDTKVMKFYEATPRSTDDETSATEDDTELLDEPNYVDSQEGKTEEIYFLDEAFGDPLEETQQPPDVLDNSSNISRINHCKRKKRMAQNQNTDKVSDAVIKFLEEKRSRGDVNILTLNERRALTWGQDLDTIRDRNIVRDCVIQITTIIQNALVQDED